MRKQPGYIPPDAYNGIGSVVWETPLPFDEYDLPTFPVDALPETVRRYVLAVAESTQTSVDMAAVEALGVCPCAAKENTSSGAMRTEQSRSTPTQSSFSLRQSKNPRYYP